MMNLFNIHFKQLFAIVILVAINCSCNKPFDAPPLEEMGQLPVNYSIKELKTAHTSKGSFQSINNDFVISGIVIANDKSGNFYQQVILQDSTGAIPIIIDGNNLYTTFPLGRKVYVKLKGLTIGDYGGVIQLGAGVDNSVAYQPKMIPIALPLINKYIVKGSYDNNINPIKVTIKQLDDNIQNKYQSCLINIEDLQFQSSDIGKPYADTTKTESALNYIMTNGWGDSITLRNSSYALFAGAKLPKGNGSITGIYGIFNSTIQLTIRDTSDLSFSQTRFITFYTTYNFNDVTQNSGTTDPTLSPTNDQVEFGQFKAVNVDGNSSKSKAFSFKKWPIGAIDGSDNFTGSVDLTKYYEVTIAPNNAILTLNKLSFAIGRTTTGIRKMMVRSNLDNFTNNLKIQPPLTNTELQVLAGNVLQISDKSLTNEDGITIKLDSNYNKLKTPITFRWYGYNAEDSNGTFILDNILMEGFTKKL